MRLPLAGPDYLGRHKDVTAQTEETQGGGV